MSWRPPPPDSRRCNIGVIDAANATDLSAYYSEPLLIRGGARTWPAQQRWSFAWLLREWGDLAVALAPGIGDTTVRAYLDELRQQPTEPPANLTASPQFVFQPLSWDWLGTRGRLQWSDVEADVRLPAFLAQWGRGAADLRELGNWFLSVGPSGSGQHFHSHGEAFNAVVAGRKRWFFLPPGSAVEAGEYASSLEFARRLPAEGVMECTQDTGDVVVVPAQVPHAVINVGDTVSVSLDRV